MGSHAAPQPDRETCACVGAVSRSVSCFAPDVEPGWVALSWSRMHALAVFSAAALEAVSASMTLKLRSIRYRALVLPAGTSDGDAEESM